jgi:integrase/recombinase XerD
MRPAAVFVLAGAAALVLWPHNLGACACPLGGESPCTFIRLLNAEVIVVGEADVRAAAGSVLAALREAARSEETVRRYQPVLDRFADFLAGRGLDTASDQVCVDFIANQTGTRLGALLEPVRDRDVQAVRRPVVLMAGALAGRPVVIDESVIPARDNCPARFRRLRDDYVASCRARGNAGATVATKDQAASQFLSYLDVMGLDDLAALGVRDLSGFLLRQRGLRGKTIAGRRSVLADFLAFLSAAGRTPQNLASRLPPHRHLRHESEPHLWTAEEIRRVLAVIDRQSAAGKRDHAMILMTARLGLRVSDLRQLALGDLDWRAKALTIIQHKTGRPLSLPLLDDVGWAIIDYVRHGRPETACPKVFVKHRHPFGTFGSSSSVAGRLSHYAARAGIEFPPGQAHGMHSLRGALAVAMIGNGTPVPVVSAVLGHASSDTAQAYYLRFDTGRLRCCALDVEDVLDQPGAGEPGA